jgi:hypothetical protein
MTPQASIGACDAGEQQPSADGPSKGTLVAGYMITRRR